MYSKAGGLPAGAIAANTARVPFVPSLQRSLDALGDPTYATIALDAWRADQTTRTVGGFLCLSIHAEPPDALLDAAATRLDGLDADARRIVATLACLARAASFDEVRAIAGPETERVRSLLANLEVAGIVTNSGTYGLARPIEGEAQLHRMSATSLAHLHADTFRALRLRKLRGAPIPTAELARHALLSGEQPLELRRLLADASAESERHNDAVREVEDAVRAGRWDEAIAVLDAHTEPALASDLVSAHDLLCAGAPLRARRGDLAGGIDDGVRAVAVAEKLGAQQTDARTALGIALLECGTVAEARVHLNEITVRDPAGWSVLAEVLTSLKDVHAARDALAHAGDSIHAARVTAEIALIRGDRDGAIATLEPWIDYEDDPFERARILEMQARQLFAKDRTIAITRATIALDLYTTLGAQTHRERTRALIENSMRTRGRPRSATLLTERESEILAFVKRGLTDRTIASELFVSVATVRKHLESIKRKLGVSRRIELLIAPE